MRIRGKSNIKEEDILFYNCIANVAKGINKRVADELTPTFIVDEAIAFFSDKEDFESCQIIKNFFEKNPSFFIKISRAEWFGTIKTKKK